ILCTGETYKAVVKLTFAKGAALDDPSRLFNASLDGNTRRAIDIQENDEVNEKAFKTLIKAAVALNTSKKKKARSPHETAFENDVSGLRRPARLLLRRRRHGGRGPLPAGQRHRLPDPRDRAVAGRPRRLGPQCADAALDQAWRSARGHGQECLLRLQRRY